MTEVRVIVLTHLFMCYIRYASGVNSAAERVAIHEWIWEITKDVQFSTVSKSFILCIRTIFVIIKVVKKDFCVYHALRGF